MPLTGLKPVPLSESRCNSANIICFVILQEQNVPGVSEFATGDARAVFVGIFVWCVVLKANKQPQLSILVATIC